ncbi:hypothetical protein AVEN_196304-1 [Araneus ventricosus]|uniref:Uncharacterized protein n=1 Tax=Araneus ventricosus TaxID=182803 RepID=A0A4Y2LP20_ARAVE|nr:hypothetical protein AVEN_196304-1 [Araneus ventricosus]
MISNRLISLTDPKYNQLAPVVSKSSQIRLGLPTAVVGDRFGVSDRAVAAITSSVLHDVGLITISNSDLVVNKNKLRREKSKVKKDLKFQSLSEAQALPLKGLYCNGRKDSTLIEERLDTKRYMGKAKQEHLSLIEEPGSRYIIHLSPSFGTAKQISATIIGYFEGFTRDLSRLLAIDCDGTSVRCLELKLGKPLDNQESSESIEEILRKEIPSQDLKMKNCRKIKKKGLSIDCLNEKDSKHIIDKIQNKVALNKKISARPPRKRHPSIIIYNLPHTTSEEGVMLAIQVHVDVKDPL